MSDQSLENVARRERWFHKITVEPPMFLYMMSYMLTSVVEQVFFLYKACTVNHGYPPDVCIAIQQYEDIKQDVQITASTFHMWNNVAMFVVPIILALFMGAWSDRRGRKLPLILGLVGKLFYSAMLVVNARMDSWPVQYVIYTATIPSVLTGVDIAVFGACYAYISDVTSTTDRTDRITILEIAYLSTMPIGVIVGRYIYSHVAKSFAIMFAINVLLLFAAIIYSTLCLKSQTTDRQISISVLRWYQIPADFFDWNHVDRSLVTLFKKRSLNRRAYLYALMASISFYNFQRDEKSIMYLYTQLKFSWDEDRFSYFRTYQTATYVVLLFLGMPLFTKVLRLRDTIIVMFGAMVHAVARFVFISAQTDWMMYAGATVSSLGPMVAPVIRSMISKMFPVNERGIIFSFLSVFDNATTLVSGVLYTEVYNASIGSYPQAFFWVTIVTQIIVVVLAMGIHVSLRGKTFEESTSETEALLDSDQHSTGESENSRTERT